MKNKEEIFKTLTIVLLLDQIVKLIICQKMKVNQLITIIPKFFSLFYVKNTGAAFSILKNNTSLIVIISCIVLSIIDWYIKQNRQFSKIEKLALGLITGGIVGNLIDRVLHHAVIDYFYFQFGSYDFPIFNIADIAITVGVTLMIVDMFMDKKEEKKQNPIKLIKIEETKPKKNKKKKKESTK